MAYLIIKHKVKDYPKWRTIFDEHAETRKAHGCLGAQLFRSKTDPSEVFILFKWDSLEKAREFSESEDMRKTMERAGVIGKPEITYFEQSDTLAA